MKVQVLKDLPEHLIFQEIPEQKSFNEQLLDFVKLEGIFWTGLLVLFLIIKLFAPGLQLANLMMVWLVINLLQTGVMFVIFLLMIFSENMAKKYPINYTLWDFNKDINQLSITHKANGLDGEVTELPLDEFERAYIEKAENEGLYFLYFTTVDGDPIEIEESQNYEKLERISQLVNRFFAM